MTICDNSSRAPQQAAFSLKDLEAAKVELANIERRIDGYDGNNPEKFQSALKLAQIKVRQIEQVLRAAGLAELDDNDKLMQRLDAMFPNARHKDVVVCDGLSYKCTYYPGEYSRSGKTVKIWRKRWEALTTT